MVRKFPTCLSMLIAFQFLGRTFPSNFVLLLVKNFSELYCMDISLAERYHLSYFLPYREGIFVIFLKDYLSFAREFCHLPERLSVICQRYGFNVGHLQESLLFITEAARHCKRLSFNCYRGCLSFAREVVFNLLERLSCHWRDTVYICVVGVAARTCFTTDSD